MSISLEVSEAMLLALPLMATNQHKASGADNRILTLLFWVAIAAGLLVAYGELQRFWQETTFLSPSHGASWIRRQRPLRLPGYGPIVDVVFFQTRVVIPPQSGPHVVTFVALRSCEVHIDGRTLYSSPVRLSQASDGSAKELHGELDWKVPHQVLLPRDLTPGEHLLEIVVRHSMGPAAVLAYCDSLELRTGRDWTASGPDFTDEPVGTVDDVELPVLSERFPSSARALASSLRWLGPCFIAVTLVLWGMARATNRSGAPRIWNASTCRWIVIAAWFALAANNFTKLPPGIGYDLQGHVDYVRFIAERGRLPDARDGAQMFQAPLFYLLSAGLYRLCILFVSGPTALVWLRWIPLLCGIAQVEIVFLAARGVFPGRDALQCLVVLFGGLLPMNVYMAQVLSNEPLSGALSALALVWAWQALREPALGQTARWQWREGIVLGLALLAKVSAVLLMPIVAVVMLVTNRSRGLKATLSGMARCFGASALLAGWYYARNAVLFGKAFVGGWDYPVTGMIWWQDPGYRTPHQIESFGPSLWRPIHAGFYSIWDGFFATFWLDGNLSSMDSWDARPPWNATLLVAAPWPALILSIAIAAGLLRGLFSKDIVFRGFSALASVTIALYLAAFFMVCMEVPAYSQAKASYTLGLTPLYAVACVAGLDLLPRNAIARSMVGASIVCWSILVYTTYFVW